jgi:L-glutamine-phosphate cytidylyltransferase
LIFKNKANSFNFKLTYFHNQRWDKTNMVSSLLCASEWLEKYECLVSYSDIVYSHKAIEKIKGSTADIAITYDPNWKELWSLRFENPLDDAETFKLNKNIVTEVGHRTSCYSNIEGQFMGIIKFSPKGWVAAASYIDKLSLHEIDKLDMTALLQLLITKGLKITGIPVYDQWFEVDTESDLKIYEDLLSND